MTDDVTLRRDVTETDSEVRSELAIPRDQDVTTMAVLPVRPAEVRTPATDNRDRQPLPLFSTNEAQGLRSRWEALQVSFVDEPKHAVEDADNLVSETINTLSKSFASEREKLEQQWRRGENVSTEDLRLALRRYRSFFERLLAI